MPFAAYQPAPQQRIGDAARDAAVEELRAHMAAGRLTMDEFDDRMSQALQAKTQPELDALFTDLPTDPDAVAGISVWRAANVPKRPSAANPMRVAQRWLIILAPVLWLTVLTGWHLWWLVYVAWAALFIVLNRLERRSDQSEPRQLDA
ncbi:MAG: DUF1707 domain-containing protein [Propionibacteriaceae bacterium]|nr:DUF1707 domain-containing protein [Propionibacteriaceae bacterium]